MLGCVICCAEQLDARHNGDGGATVLDGVRGRDRRKELNTTSLPDAGSQIFHESM